MKRKVCIRSMVLGAVIMLVGLAVGAIVSPPLIAQRERVYDKIQCRELEVGDENGNQVIGLRGNGWKQQIYYELMPLMYLFMMGGCLCNQQLNLS